MSFLGISAEQFLAAMTKATAPNSEHKVSYWSLPTSARLVCRLCLYRYKLLKIM